MFYEIDNSYHRLVKKKIPFFCTDSNIGCQTLSTLKQSVTCYIHNIAKYIMLGF